MKKIIIAIMAVALPLMVQAQSEGLISRKAQKGKSDMSVYTAKGAVPEEAGRLQARARKTFSIRWLNGQTSDMRLTR